MHIIGLLNLINRDDQLSIYDMLEEPLCWTTLVPFMPLQTQPNLLFRIQVHFSQLPISIFIQFQPMHYNDVHL